MAVAVMMPRQGQSVESCIFTEWFVKKGDKVSKGDLLFAYETDKAAFEQEALEDGVLLETFVDEGDDVPVLSNIGVIGAEGESTAEFLPEGSAPAETTEAAAPAPAPVEETTTEAESTTAPATAATGEHKISPRAKKLAASSKLTTEGLAGSGPYGRIIAQDVEAAIEAQPKATPLARSIAATDKVPMPSNGSGANGKITARDVKQMPSITFGDDYKDNKLPNIRKIISEKMYESLANTAQLTLHSSADARKMLAARKEVKKKMAEGYQYNLTINDMVSVATVKALQKHADMNAHFLGDAMRNFENVHLGFAVDTPRGLMVPTIKNANHLSIEGISAQTKQLANDCLTGSVDPELLQGATFTMTNLGSFGIEMFTPVLNPPQVGILGVNTITHQPGDVGDGVFGFIPKIGLSITFDHRALDGAPAARFLQDVKAEIENFTLNI